MTLTPKRVPEFINIWEQEIGERLDPEDAAVKGGRLKPLFTALENLALKRGARRTLIPITPFLMFLTKHLDLRN